MLGSSALRWKRSQSGGLILHDVMSFGWQIALVASIELIDDGIHVLIGQNNVHTAQTNAVDVVRFEAAHGFWVEPSIQQFFTRTHDVLGLVFGWAQAETIADTLYGLGHVFITLGFAFWIFCYRGALFGFLRNVFLITSVLADMLYETFPLAPPRLATGLRFDGHPVHLIDTVFGAGSGLQIGFNEYAAMPSLHVAWATIVGVTVAWLARSVVVRALALIYPLIMLIAVVVTGNHYIVDGLGAVGVVCCAVVLAVLIEWRRAADRSLLGVLGRLHALRQPTQPEIEVDQDIGKTVPLHEVAA
jgi:membrane-associated phospholipid phosphatase